MIRVLLRIRWLNLRRDYVALGLTFILPVVFFSLFALIFGKGAMGSEEFISKVQVVLVDQDSSEFSGRLIQEIRSGKAIRVFDKNNQSDASSDHRTYSLEAARDLVRKGKVPVAVVLPRGLEQALEGDARETIPIEIIYDASNPAARYIVSGHIKQSAIDAAPDALLRALLNQFDGKGLDMTPGQWDVIKRSGPIADQLDRVFPIKYSDVRGKQNDMISYYAAGIGTMFLLFSLVSAGGSLLEDEETGTLERLLNSRVGMGTLLIGNWIFFTALGITQMIIMFVWGALLFGVNLWTLNHLGGVIAMTVVTAAAASAFGIILATLSRTHAQLSGISTVVILVMSALGGSMAPKVFMPDFMGTVSLFTLNGWALDGYLKVLWYDDPGATLIRSLIYLWPHLLVLSGMTLCFLAIAFKLKTRWETV